MLSISCKKGSDENTSGDTLTDSDGNNYGMVTIGTQVWMDENLKTTKYKDNSSIPLVTDNTDWSNLVSPGYSWYNNDASSNKATYGALYNWHTVNTGKLCPTGWHVPTDDEWRTLTSYLGGEAVAGGKLKEAGTSHWLSPNLGATNESGFTAVPGGARNIDGQFLELGTNGYWWSSTAHDATHAWYHDMVSDDQWVNRFNYYKGLGFSVRCIKD
jgi:uncharacterized protein (TIGR02145 family)